MRKKCPGPAAGVLLGVARTLFSGYCKSRTYVVRRMISHLLQLQSCERTVRARLQKLCWGLPEDFFLVLYIQISSHVKANWRSQLLQLRVSSHGADHHHRVIRVGRQRRRREFCRILNTQPQRVDGRTATDCFPSSCVLTTKLHTLRFLP